MKALWLSILWVAAASATTLHVSPTGDDAHSGTSPQLALRTIQAAANLLQPGDACLVAEGVYREAVTFPRSGEPGRPITLRAAPGAKVEVTGCEPLTGWTLHDAARGIWRAPMAWTLGTGRNQVFVDGEVNIEARFPNQPDADLGMYVADLSPLWPTYGEFSLPRETMKQQPGRIISEHLKGQPDNYWKGALYVGLHYEGWCNQTGVIDSSKAGEINVGDRTRTWWFGPAYGGDYSPEEGRGMIVGHMNALDQPGEWHWQDGWLYLIPKAPGAPRNVQAKRRQLAFDLSGRQYLEVEGLSIKAASVRLADSAFCRFDRCDLSYVSHFTRQYDIGQVEAGRDTIKSGETGIYISGHDNSFLNCSVRVSAGAGFHLRGYHHTIHNCLVDEVSYTAHYLNAITDAVSDFGDYENCLYGGHVITYNTLRNAGRHFFNFHGNGTSTASRDRAPMDYMATLFAHNHCYNGMLLTKDAGFLTGYYSSGGTLCGLNSQVAYNVLHDSYDLAAMRWGALGIVYLDAGSCDVDLHDNLLWAAPGSLQRGLWYNTMCVDVHERDNVFWPDFTRNSAQLRADDFPRGRPFAFGHDVERRPTVPVWPPLDQRAVALAPTDLTSGAIVDLGEVDFGAGWQAAVMDWSSEVAALNTDRSGRQVPRHSRATDPLVMEVATNDGQSDKLRHQWTFVHNVTDGAWLRFAKVPLGDGYERVRFVYGNDQPDARTAEVRLDAVDGPVAARVRLPQTDKPRGGHIQIYAAATAPLGDEARGTHDLFVVFRSPDGKPVGEFEYFRLERYRGAMPLAPNEAQVELRLDSAVGTRIGTFYPRATASAVRQLVAHLEPVSGRHRLVATVRSAVAGPLGRASAVRLMRGLDAIGIDGGLETAAADGKLVLPQPTNRPVARPGDKIAAATAPATSRSLLTAPLGADAERALRLTLEQNFDGGPLTTSPSTATVSYDAEALHITVRSPVGHGTRLLPSSHEWGAVDGVEVAFQAWPAGPKDTIRTLYGYPDGHFAADTNAGATAQEADRLQRGTTYSAKVDGDEWSCAWRIPFDAAGLTPTGAPLWSFNVGVRKTSPAGWAVWRGTGGANYRVAYAGLLTFGEALANAGPPKDGLIVWLDASNRDSTVTTDGGRLTVWRDLSGLGHHAVQPDARYTPQRWGYGLNGRTSIRFDEKRATRLELPDLAEDKIDATVLAVINNPVAGSEVNHDPRIFTSSDGKGYDYQLGIALSVPGMTTGGPRVVQQSVRGAWAKQVRVGCFSPAYQTFFTGDIAEILVYNRTLNPTDVQRVRAYLVAKWRLPS